MPMNPEMRKAVEVIDQRIAHLQKIKQMLIGEFGEAPVGGPLPIRPVSRHSDGRNNRKAELEAFLRSRGPTTRKEIIAQSGVPEGTIGWLLSKDWFVRTKDRRWTVREMQQQAGD